MSDVVVCGGLSAAVVLWCIRVPRWWRGDWKWDRDPDLPPRSWPYGAALWSGFVRLPPLSGVLMAVLLLTYVALRLGRAAWLLPIQIALGVAFMLLLGAAFTVVLFNRPKCAVAPSLRTRPGAAADWMAAARARRR